MEFFNTEYFWKMIALYLKVFQRKQKGEKRHFVPFVDGRGNVVQAFFFEVVYRAISLMIRQNNQEGVADLSTTYLWLIEDFNAPLVATASNLCLDSSAFERYRLALDRDNQKHLFASEPFLKATENQNSGAAAAIKSTWTEELAKQALQELFALQMLGFYYGEDRASRASFFEQATHFFFSPEDADWKEMRCAFFRYLCYAGFVKVTDKWSEKNRGGIMSDSIPRSEVLVGLAQRFFELSGWWDLFEPAWAIEAKIPPGADIRVAVLNPRMVARQFLRFNRVEDPSLMETVS